jgi:hypothetical protein
MTPGVRPLACTQGLILLFPNSPGFSPTGWPTAPQIHPGPFTVHPLQSCPHQVHLAHYLGAFSGIGLVLDTEPREKKNSNVSSEPSGYEQGWLWKLLVSTECKCSLNPMRWQVFTVALCGITKDWGAPKYSLIEECFKKPRLTLLLDNIQLLKIMRKSSMAWYGKVSKTRIRENRAQNNRIWLKLYKVPIFLYVQILQNTSQNENSLWGTEMKKCGKGNSHFLCCVLFK